VPALATLILILAIICVDYNGTEVVHDKPRKPLSSLFCLRINIRTQVQRADRVQVHGVRARHDPAPKSYSWPDAAGACPAALPASQPDQRRQRVYPLDGISPATHEGRHRRPLTKKAAPLVLKPQPPSTTGWPGSSCMSPTPTNRFYRSPCRQLQQHGRKWSWP
jgi:hypothetical protein